MTGTEAWVYRLKIADQFSKAKKEPMEINGIPQAFVKVAKTFEYYYILAAGHMVKHYLDQNTEKIEKNADFNTTVHVFCVVPSESFSPLYQLT